MLAVPDKAIVMQPIAVVLVLVTLKYAPVLLTTRPEP